MKIFLSKIFIGLSLVTININTINAESDSQLQAKAIMGNVYEAYVKILPYAYSKTNQIFPLKDKNQKTELLKNLNDLSSFFNNAKHADFFKTPGLRPSLETITGHLKDTISAVESENYSFAEKRLNIIGALCVSCHSQLPAKISKNAFGKNIKIINRENFDSDFSYANYLFLVREFEEAKKYFSLNLLDSMKNQSKIKSNQEVLFSLRRMITIDTKIKFNFEKSHAFIEKWKNESRLSLDAQKILSKWSEDLKQWKDFNPSQITSLPNFIQKHLTPLDSKKENILTGDKDMSLLISSGILYNFLVENSKTELAPEILYWLSLIEHRMEHTYFYSLGDLYLKDCIKKYPNSPFAKKCYQEYAETIEASFSGSSGVNIPTEEKNELQKLKALLK